MDVNRNLLNQRENLQAEPSAPDMKPSKKEKTRVFRVTNVQGMSAPRKSNLVDGATAFLQSPPSSGQGMKSSERPAGIGLSMLPKVAIMLPAQKGRRVVRIAKKSIKMIPTESEGVPLGKNFNPYESSNKESSVALPQQWQQQLPLAIHHQKSGGGKRPSTPEQQRKHCLECGDMKDFIFGLQKEVKRLQDLANEFNLQIILSGGTPEEELQIEQQPKAAQPTKKNAGSEETKPDTVIKKICPECPMTQKRKQAQLKRQILEQSSSVAEASTEANTGSSSLLSPGLMRLNTNSLFPRNNLIDGSHCSNDLASPTNLRDAKSGAVRVNQLKDMRRQATFAQEQLEFVGKLTTQQQAVKLPGQNAELHSMMNSNLQTAARVATPNRVGSSNLAFRKKKMSSVIQQLPPLTAQKTVDFRPQPYHITKEDSEDAPH